MNETLKTLRERRSVRRYRPEQIKTEELEAILEKARKPKRARKAQTDENQLNLFDFVA